MPSRCHRGEDAFSHSIPAPVRNNILQINITSLRTDGKGDLVTTIEDIQVYAVVAGEVAGCGQVQINGNRREIGHFGTLGTEVTGADGATVTLKAWIYDHLFASWLDDLNASLAFAIVFIIVMYLCMLPLYRKKIFIKI